MKKKIISILLVLTMVLSLMPAITVFASAEDIPWWVDSGKGTAEDPYIIKSYAKLGEFQWKVNDGTSCEGLYIKLSDSFPEDTDEDAKKLTEPIGMKQEWEERPFKGTFDGNGKNIVLAIEGTESNVGLFGVVEGGTIKNVSTSGSVSGESNVGGVVGYNFNGGTVTNCYATCTVTGTGTKVGGVVGYNEEDNCTVINCYATGNVTATFEGAMSIGGVVGQNDSGTIMNCYATCDVIATGENADCVGGVVGYSGGTMTNCYATGNVSGKKNVGGVVGTNDLTVTNCYCIDLKGSSFGASISDDNMKLISGENALVAKLNTYATGDGKAAGCFKWNVAESYNGGYPYLVAVDTSWFDTSKTEFTLHDTADLEGLASLVNATTDAVNFEDKIIILDDNFDGTVPFATPIGNTEDNPFSGTFDGNGKNVVLAINSTVNRVGLFGYVESGTVKNVSTSGSVSGKESVGGVVGHNSDGPVTNCYSTCTVSGKESVGGVVGHSNEGKITNCYATGSVSGTGDYIGGLVGGSMRGTITNCYATGNVSGTGAGKQFFGGLAGCVDNTNVTNCYATGDVSGATCVGGVVGYNAESAVTNCYAAGEVSGTSNFGGVVGENEDGTVTNCYQIIGMQVNEVRLVDALNEYAMGEDGKTANCSTWNISSGINTGYPYFANVDYSWYSAEGTEFTLTNTAQLEGLANIVNKGVDMFENKTVKLSDTFDGSAALKTPINIFKGTFDGNNNEIKLDIKLLELGDAGLFGRVEGGTIKNTKTSGTVSGLKSVGGISARALRATFENCSSSATIKSADGGGEDGTGGIVGWTNLGNDYENSGYSYIKNCYYSGKISGIVNVGGIAGNFQNGAHDGEEYHCGAEITGCYFTGEINAISETAGGIVGLAYQYCGDIKIDNCYATGKINGIDCLGGILGEYSPQDYPSSCKITDCHFSGSIKGSQHDIGGIVGCGCISIANCYVTGEVYAKCGGDFVYNVGGIAGDGATATNCYVTGRVTVDSLGRNIGGVIGGGTAINSYATGAVSVTGDDSNTIGGVVGGGTAINCYASNYVYVEGSGTYSIGSVVGNGVATNCYYLEESDYKGVGVEIGEAVDEDGKTTVLSNAQMSAYGSSTEPEDADPEWASIKIGEASEKYPLVDALNIVAEKYNEDNATDITAGTKIAYAQWSRCNGFNQGYPYFQNWNIDWFNGEGAPTGTEADPFIISTAEELEGLAYIVNNHIATGNAMPTGEIVAEPTSVVQKTYGFEDKFIKLADTFEGSVALKTPIGGGVEIYAFRGTFDGNNKEIKLDMRNNLYASGLFSYVSGGKVINTKTSGTVTGITYIGGIVGYLYDGTVENCSSSAEIIGTDNDGGGGGIVGYIYLGGAYDDSEYSYIKDCYSTGTVTKGEYAGGILGYIYGGYPNDEETECKSGVEIIDCYSTGDISAKYEGIAGGIVGDVSPTCAEIKIDGCHSTGKIDAKDNAGGIVGHIDVSNQTLSSVEITDCYSTGKIKSLHGTAGGIAGSADGCTTISNCYSTGDITILVTDANPSVIGGIAGGGKAINCYSTGNIVATVTGEDCYISLIGGIVGNGTAINCYATGNITVTVIGDNTKAYSIGGVVGNGTATNCYSSGTVSAMSDSTELIGGIVGEGTAKNCFCTMSTLVGNGTQTDCYQIDSDKKVGPEGEKQHVVNALNKHAKSEEGVAAGCFRWNYYDGYMDGYPYLVVEDTSWFDASKTEFVLHNTAELAGLASIVNNHIATGGTEGEKTYGFEGKTIKLADDFDGAVAVFTPIGNRNNRFKGTFDGNNKEIMLHMWIDQETRNMSLFGFVDGGTIKNTKTSGTISNPFDVGGIVACLNNGTVENCSSSVDIYHNGGDGGAGGVVGQITIDGEPAYSYVKNCYSTGNLQGEAMNSGVVGYISKSNTYDSGKEYDCGAVIKDCYSTGNITYAYEYSGGIVGQVNLEYGTVEIDSCYSTGNIKGCFRLGGILGGNILSYAGEVTITDCYSTGNVEGKYFLGGIAGTASDIINCYSTGNVTATSDEEDTVSIGGIVGSGKATNCYSTGNISAICTGTAEANSIGGVVGSGSAINCYTTGTVSITGNTKKYIGGVIGKVDAEGTATNCYYLASESYNGVGAETGKGTDVAGKTTALTDAQMKGTAGTVKALVDSLNFYSASVDGVAKGCYLWKNDSTTQPKNGGYPVFTGKVAVCRIGNVGYTSLQDAVDAVKNGEVIYLASDNEEDVTVKSAKNFVIDDNEGTFKYKALKVAKGLQITLGENGAVTVTVKQNDHDSGGFLASLIEALFHSEEGEGFSLWDFLSRLIQRIIDSFQFN